MGQVYVRPIGALGRFADWLMRPLMYLAAGTVWEEPQTTHRWNNRKLSDHEVCGLDTELLLVIEGDPTAGIRWFLGFIPRFHIPVWGGWRRYAVIEPEVYTGTDVWYLGWVGEDIAKLSRIPNVGAVRTLRGPRPMNVFGVNAAGVQIPLTYTDAGIIGEGGPYTHLPLR